MTDAFFGDSQTQDRSVVGYNVGVPYPFHYTGFAKTGRPTIKAIGGSCAADMTLQAFYNMGTYARNFFMIGTNDHRTYPNNANGLDLFQRTVHASALMLSSSFKPIYGPDWTLTGSWAPDLGWGPYFGAVVKTHTNGNSATINFTGDFFDLLYLIIDTDGANFTMTVDGNPVSGAVQCGGAVTISTALGTTWTPAAIRRSGFGAGAHTLVITTNIPSSGHPVCLMGLGDGTNGKSLKILSIPKANLGATVEAARVAYNGVLATVASDCAASGLDVAYLDVGSEIDPSQDISTDNLHLNNQGSAVIASAMHKLI